MDLSAPTTSAAAPVQAAPADRDSPKAPAVRPPRYGEGFRHFIAASDHNPRFQTLSLGGLWTCLVFLGSLSQPLSRAAHERILARRALFDDRRAYLFGVSVDPADRNARGLANSLPGLRYFWDFDLAASRLWGLAGEAGFAPMAFLLDPGLRVAAVQPLDRIDALLDRLEAELHQEGQELGAPVLTLPRILEPEFCRALVELYETHGGEESGFMRQVEGATIGMKDHGTKRRRDYTIPPENPLHAGLRARLADRLVPAIERAFCWRPTRIERYIVACYSAEDRGFFKPHRDNTTTGTAHRRFAVTINLNEDFEGGDLRFPEYGRRLYRPPPGGATVFACGLLHEATPVTRGVRYATLPFLYDDAAAQLRKANAGTIRQAAD